jgi:hypothetical protein
MNDKIKTITDAGLIDSAEFFAKVIEKMHGEGNGLMTTTLVTPKDATNMLLAHIIGAGKHCELYFMECDKFLSSLEDESPKCSAIGCDKPMASHRDVGVIVIVHGTCDEPTTCILSGICSSCWVEKFKKDRDKAMEGFLDYLRDLLPGMKVHDKAEFETQMAGNAPSTSSIN